MMIKLSSTAYSDSNSRSSMTVNWPRPYDGLNPPACISEYIVNVYGVRHA